jgi:hypothetical protein
VVNVLVERRTVASGVKGEDHVASVVGTDGHVTVATELCDRAHLAVDDLRGLERRGELHAIADGEGSLGFAARPDTGSDPVSRASRRTAGVDASAPERALVR